LQHLWNQSQGLWTCCKWDDLPFFFEV
jgi:hypothetical protein